MSSKAVFGLADNSAHADRIINRLLNSGFTNEDISVLVSEKDSFVRSGRATEVVYEDDVNMVIDRPISKQKKGSLGTEKHTKAPEGATAGTIAGGVIGGALGLLAGIGTLAIPGLGVLIAAGPILGALSGSAVGGTVGLLVGALVGLGIPEYEAKKFEDAVKKGLVLICVHTANSKQVEQAKKILEQEKARDIATSKEKVSSSY